MGAVAISIGAWRCAADRSGESDDTTCFRASGSDAKRYSNRAGSRLTRSASGGRGGRAERPAWGFAQPAQRIAGRRIETLEDAVEGLPVGCRVEDPDQRPRHADCQLRRYGVLHQPIGAWIRSRGRQHRHLLEVGERSDAGDDRDSIREVGRGAGEKRERSSYRDTEETDPPVAGLGRVGRAHRTFDGGRERQERELAGCDAWKLWDEDDVSGSCERGCEAAYAGVSPAVGCRAVHEHHSRPGRSRPRPHRRHRPRADGPLPEVRGRVRRASRSRQVERADENARGTRLDAQLPQRFSGARGKPDGADR